MSDTPRAEMRAEMRDDPRARATARARELLEFGVMEVDTTDKFRMDASIIPDGWSYEWKRRTVYNQEDPSYQVNLAATGWEPVPPDRHPEFMPEGWRGNTIERDGMVLMERPKEITDRMRARAERDAVQPIKDLRAKLSGVPDGQFQRVDAGGNSTVKVNRTYEAMQIPE